MNVVYSGGKLFNFKRSLLTTNCGVDVDV